MPVPKQGSRGYAPKVGKPEAWEVMPPGLTPKKASPAPARKPAQVSEATRAAVTKQLDTAVQQATRKLSGPKPDIAGAGRVLDAAVAKGRAQVAADAPTSSRAPAATAPTARAQVTPAVRAQANQELNQAVERALGMLKSSRDVKGAGATLDAAVAKIRARIGTPAKYAKKRR